MQIALVVRLISGDCRITDKVYVVQGKSYFGVANETDSGESVLEVKVLHRDVANT